MGMAPFGTVRPPHLGSLAWAHVSGARIGRPWGPWAGGKGASGAAPRGWGMLSDGADGLEVASMLVSGAPACPWAGVGPDSSNVSASVGSTGR